MSTELAIQPEQTGFTDKQVAALRSLGVEDAPPGDVALLFHQSVRTGLDPFLKQIYLIGRASREQVDGRWQDGPKKWTIQTGIDGFRVIRDRSGTYDGQEVAWCGPDGRWRDVWTAPEPPFAARVLVYVKGRSRPEPGIAYFSEYAQTDRNGNPQAMWKTRPAGQLAKCAEALALRKAYPQDLSGIYTDDEMQQAENGPDGVPSITSVRDSGRNPGHTGKRGHASETRVTTAPGADATPGGASRPSPSRTVTSPGAGRATPAEEAAGQPTSEEDATVADFAEAIRASNSNTVLEKLWSDAGRLRTHRTAGGGPTLGQLIRERKEFLDRREQEADDLPPALDGIEDNA